MTKFSSQSDGTPQPEPIFDELNLRSMAETVVNENTQLKRKLMELSRTNYDQKTIILQQKDEIASLNDQIDAQAIAFDQQLQMMEKQVNIYQQNDDMMRNQVQGFYSSDKVELMKELGNRYIDDVDTMKNEMLTKYRTAYEKQLANVIQTLQKNHDFIVQSKDAEIGRWRRKYEESCKKQQEKVDLLKKKYDGLKRAMNEEAE